MTGAISRLLARLERWGTAAENASLVLLLGSLMILAVGQIVLRTFFDSGLIWADELLRIMVLWIALTKGMVDIFSAKKVPEAAK